jgi:formiminotetrahydrofolate cyclodeaminase
VKLTDQNVSDLLAAFRSASPTPGGGSAAALAGAIGVSLLAMVAGLPTSRAAIEGDADRLRAAGERCTALSAELATLVDRDTDAYNLVVAAYRSPKGTDAERSARAAAVQQAMRAAIDAPLEIMRACAAAAEHGVVIATLGNPSASSDAQVGFELLNAALRGARLNVETNAARVKDADYVARVRADVEALGRAIARDTAAAVRAVKA